MRRNIWLLPSLLVFAALTMGQDSCSESVDKANKAAEDLEKKVEPNKQIDDQVKQLSLGMSIDDVRAQMGPPDDSQVSKSQYGTLQYLYYGQWQLGFTDGVLDSKSKF
jgi:hypothetical protein